MPVRAEWANAEKTILLEIIEGEWTLTDVFALVEMANKMVAGVTQKVDIIADLTNAHFSKANLLSALGSIQRSQSSTNVGKVIAVKANNYLKAITNVASKLSPKAVGNIMFVETLDQAYALLNENVKN